jgi:hypothetical protein
MPSELLTPTNPTVMRLTAFWVLLFSLLLVFHHKPPRLVNDEICGTLSDYVVSEPVKWSDGELRSDYFATFTAKDRHTFPKPIKIEITRDEYESNIDGHCVKAERLLTLTPPMYFILKILIVLGLFWTITSSRRFNQWCDQL